MQEASFFAILDGETALPLVGAQDHKAAHDGDEGPNTGGMGAYSPAPVLDAAMTDRVMNEIVLPMAKGMAHDGMPYHGVLFVGLMIDDNGPRVVEFNCRFGDPECQVVMMRLDSDLLDLLYAASTGKLADVRLSWRDDVALSVVMAANGYPGKYKKGSEIKNLEVAGAPDGVQIFHAGTKADDGKILATGGRVLNITAVANDVKNRTTNCLRGCRFD